MPFQVIFDGRAECDVHNYERRLARINRQTLSRWHGQLAMTIRALEADPLRYPGSHEAEDIGMLLRDAFFGKYPHLYRLVYVTLGQVVNVLRVRHAAMDWLTADDL